MGLNDEVPQWSLGRRILFRFFFVYFILYVLPFPLTVIPFAEILVQPYQKFWHIIVPWVGDTVFGTPVPEIQFSGSGDKTFDYVQVFCFFAAALVICTLWSGLDRARPNYRRLHDWLRVYLRFSLATSMILYGSVKVIKSQFPGPSLDRLLQPFGDASPMGLLWTFMGASSSYNVFTGIGEMLGGLLLTTRRTTLLGALVCLAVMSNVVMLNFSYDVPVKLFSMHLLAMAIFLTAPDLQRFVKLFLLNRPVEPADLRPLFGIYWLDLAVIFLRTVLMIGFTGLWLYNAHEMRKQYGDLAPKSPLYGIWNVDEFTIDGETRPPLTTDATRWRRVIFDYPQMIAFQLMDDHRQRYVLALDDQSHTLTLTKRDDPNWKTVLTYQQTEPGLLAIEGSLEGKPLRAKLRLTDASQFLLINRGFHWINEYPFNR